MTERVGVTVLGATGSVGKQTLEVLQAFPERFQLVGMAAHRDVDTMLELVNRYRPRAVAMADSRAARALSTRLEGRLSVDEGPESLVRLARATEAEVVVAALVGSAGVPSVFAAVQAGKRVALANKESLVMAGELIMAEARRSGARILPVDSEHAAAHQLLQTLRPAHLTRLWLTASGGPFLGRSPAELAGVTVAEALAHPRWTMGAKISIDSATMMNKGFEVIEARWLFDLDESRIGVVIHPESLIHAMVETVDGAVLAQLARPDMRGPIAYALAHPDRLDLPGRFGDGVPLEFGVNVPSLGFVDASAEAAHPALALCRLALRTGGGLSAALASADDVVVEAFLQKQIGFNRITEILTEVAERFRPRPIGDLQDMGRASSEGEELARALCVRHS